MAKAIVLFLLAAAVGAAAAPFQNLGFDEANTNGVAPNTFGPASQMLPGWKVFDEHGEAGLIGYNADIIGLNQVVLYDNSYRNFGLPPLDGGYALGLWPGPGLDVTKVNPYHLSQIGEVPQDAKTIHFVNFGSPFDLYVNGQEVLLIYDYPPDYPAPLFNRHIPVPAVGDISAFAGQTVELEFLTAPPPFRPGDTLRGIDSIFFSPESLPEPSTWALFALGVVGLFFKWGVRRGEVQEHGEGTWSRFHIWFPNLAVSPASKSAAGVWTFFGHEVVDPDDASESSLPEGDSRIAHPFKGGMAEQQSKSRRDG